MNKNSIVIGFISGAIVPILGIAIFYLIKYMPDQISVLDFIFMIKINQYLIPKIISLGLITCIPLITYFKNRRLYNSLKGVFAAIIIYGLIALAYKFNLL